MWHSGIVLLGGTFDPVHRGHVQAALAVREALRIDDVRLLPAGDPPHRSNTHATAGQRLEMLERALAPHPELSIDRSELERAGPSYMVDTLQAFRDEDLQRPLVLVVGQDAANQLDQWHRWQQLLALAHLVIVNRPRQPSDYSEPLAAVLDDAMTGDVADLHRRPAGNALHLSIEGQDISSTRLRQMLQAGQPVSDWLPDGVLAFIDAQGLYR